MYLKDIQRILESLAPPSLAWERDNVGIQAGYPGQRVRKILVALDVTDDVVAEAVRKRADLIVSHHPLFFHPLRSLRTDERLGRISSKIQGAGLAVYALHTNLDYAREGVNRALADALHLQNPRPLEPLRGGYQKLIVFVPVEYSEKVMSAMAGAGAGAIGKYEECSFQVNGTGTFKPLGGAVPFIGTVQERAHVNEQRLEMIVPRWKTGEVLRAMRGAHPYEEVAYDIYDLANASPEYGGGAIGTLKKATTLKKFLGDVQKKLHAGALRYAGELNTPVTTVAVFGGSGSDRMEHAIGQGAEVFVTADIRYHTFQESDGRIALIDAGHYETEAPVIGHLTAHLRSNPLVQKEKVQIIPTETKTNFIHHFTH